MRTLSKSEKSARTRARKKNPLRAAKLVAKREVPVDGIARKEMTDGHSRERCITPDAMQMRREELYARTGSRCEGCRCVIYLESFHFHHFKGRGRGRCDCLECVQALCPDVRLLDGTMRLGCHTLQHHCVDESGCFDSVKSTRLGEPFTRSEKSVRVGEEA